MAGYDWSNTGRAAGGFLGKLLAGGSDQNTTRGLIDGANARLLMNKDKNIEEAIRLSNAGDYRQANNYSMYGGDFGRTSFDLTTNGAVFNRASGELNTNTPLAGQFMAGVAADTSAKLADAEAKRGLLPYEQEVKAAQAGQYRAAATDNYASANFRDQQARWESPRAQAEVAANLGRNAQALGAATDNYASANFRDQQARWESPRAQAEVAANLGRNAQVAVGSESWTGGWGRADFERWQADAMALRQAADARKSEIAQLLGGQPQAALAPVAPVSAGGSREFPAAAVAYLKANNTPEVMAAFQAKYGALP